MRGAVLLTARRCVFTLICSLSATIATAADLLPAETPIPQAVDHYIGAELQRQGITPAARADDPELVRRTLLDLAGRIPAVIEVREFVASADPDKHRQLVDRLIDSPEFVEHLSYEFDTFLQADGRGSMRNYLQQAFAENRSWDQMFRQILMPDLDDEAQKGSDEFLKARVKDTDRLTNDVSVVFFGINVSCAKCHDHPLVSDWKQDHFYGMKSFFNRTFDNGGFVAERDTGLVSFKTTAGEDKQARLMFLTGTVVDEPDQPELSKEEQKKYDEMLKELAKEKKAPPAPKFSRRAQLVDIALQPGQRHMFSRALVNRVWYQLFGYGLVMPLDQMHSANPSSHPDLLEWLARDFSENGYDVKRLVRGLVLSDVYARSSYWDNGDAPFADRFAVARLRPLSPQQLARSLSLATADPESFSGEMKPEDRQKRIASAASTRNANRFEQPGENFQVSADEALFFSNSADVRNSYLSGGLFNRLKQMEERDEIIRTAVEAVLSRPAEEEELQILGDYYDNRSDRREEAIRQIVWTLLTGNEFRFNH